MNPIEIQAVVFDMDGLMFNTEDLYDKVGQILLARRGHEFTRDLKLKMMGLPGTSAFEVLCREIGLDESIDALQEESDVIFRELLPSGIKTLPGLEKLLTLLEQKRVPKAVATSSHRQFAERALGMFDLKPRFEFVLTADDVAQGKPHPEIYLTAAQRLHVQPAKMLVLEDSWNGSTAAVAAGAFTIAIPTIHSRELDFHHVSHVAEALDDEEILNLFAARDSQRFAPKKINP